MSWLRNPWRPFVLLALLVLAPPCVGAQVRGEIVGPGTTRMPIAVPALQWGGGPRRPKEASEFTRLLRRDLELSGLFHVIDPSAYLEDSQPSQAASDAVRFEDWIAIGALGLIRGTYSGNAYGFSIESRFFDLADRSSPGGRKLSGDPSSVARMAQRMADAILELVTGTAGPFDSRIAFVSNRSGRFREIYVYSFDGRVARLTHHDSITMAPSWHPSGRSLVFTSFRTGRPALYEFDLRAGSDRRLASRHGVNVGGAWAPDGVRLLLAREVNGNTDLYELEPGRLSTLRLTSHWAIDVDPAWSPHGERIAFCSSRGGTPQIYTMSLGSRELRRLTFEGTYNCSPAWSPDGTMIAYAGRRSSGFQIFVVPARGGRPRQLTFSGSNEDPTWSPDSRYIAFSGRRRGHAKLYLVDAHGHWERQLTDGLSDDTSPAWSKRLD